jgi:hypothetical protein
MITFQNFVKFYRVSDITHVWKVVMSDHWRRFHIGHFEIKGIPPTHTLNLSKMMKPCQTSSKESSQEKERQRNKGQAPKSKQANSPKEACNKEAREPLSTKTSTSCMKHIN